MSEQMSKRSSSGQVALARLFEQRFHVWVFGGASQLKAAFVANLHHGRKMARLLLGQGRQFRTRGR